METIKMVAVNKKSFAFCRYTIAILIWVSVIFQLPIVACIVAWILLASYLLGVDKAPLVVLFDITIGKFTKTNKDLLNFKSIRFAHLVGCVFCTIGISFIYIFNLPIVGYGVLLFLAVLKSIAAFGYCSAAKFYECVILGSNCCNLGKKIRGGKCAR